VAARKRLLLFALVLTGVLPFEANGWYNPRLASTLRLFWAIETATWIVLPTVLLLVGLRGNLFTLADLGLSARIRGRPIPILLGFLIFIVPVGLYWLDQWAVAASAQIWPHNWWAIGFHYADLVPPAGPETGWWRLLALLHLSVTAGVVEEILYRAMLSRLFPPTTRVGALGGRHPDLLRGRGLRAGIGPAVSRHAQPLAPDLRARRDRLRLAPAAIRAQVAWRAGWRTGC
jgi:hypothetical protein